MSDSLWSHGLYPARLLCSWDFTGKNTGVCCHFLLQGIFLIQGLNLGVLHCRQILYRLSHLYCFNKYFIVNICFQFLKVKVKVAQSCLTLCDPMDHSLSGSSVHGILHARILECVAIPFSRGSFQPRD